MARKRQRYNYQVQLSTAQVGRVGVHAALVEHPGHGRAVAAIDCILGRDPQVWVPHGEPPLATVLADADIAPAPSRLA